jgi:hypothetical protein
MFNLACPITFGESMQFKKINIFWIPAFPRTDSANAGMTQLAATLP